jgi:hypothetical protein
MGARGPQPGTVKKPEGSGRQPGQRNKTTAAVKELAAQHGPDAIKTLAKLAKEADSDAAKISACKELLDRAYGKATQPIAGDDDMPSIKMVSELVLRGVRSDPRD